MTVCMKHKPVKKLIMPTKRNLNQTMYTGTNDFNRMLVAYHHMMEQQRNSEGEVPGTQNFKQLAKEWIEHDGEIASSSTSPYPPRQAFCMATYNNHLIVEEKVKHLVTAFDNIVLQQYNAPKQ
ncbi:uncharacterized protein LOC126780640 [Nymphalis io]|uniref:uncharacterized protein LOC126780640 n=1 Tax=Inachis io TaxID=171585 RepID=UPI00216735B0|nr:uncharacterized protein LOC126780640 [Nymphalis io]